MAGKGDKNANPIRGFEASTKQLEALIEVLEDETTPLEKALETFEQGINLTRNLQKCLNEAEQKVQLLLKGDDGPVFKDFEEQE